MPVFKVDIQKERGGLYWTNRYLIERAEVGLTPAEVNALKSGEGQLHATTVNYVSLRMSDMVPNTDNFVVYPLSGTGGIAATGHVLPAFNTLRIDIGVGIGRPCRKYLRTFVGESQSDGPNWTTEYVTAAQDAFETLMATVTGLCDPQGNAWEAIAAKSAVQMRQLRRGSRRQTEPVIPIA